MRSSSSKPGHSKSRPPPPPPDSNSGQSESADHEPHLQTQTQTHPQPQPTSTSPTLPSPFICAGRQFHLQLKPEGAATEQRALMKEAIRKSHLKETNPEEDYTGMMRNAQQRKEEDGMYARLKQELQQCEVNHRVLRMGLGLAMDESAAQQ